MLFASVIFPVYYGQIWHFLAWIISSNTIFSKAWEQSASHLSKLWRERRERWSRLQQSWNERKYMLWAVYKPSLNSQYSQGLPFTHANSAVWCTYLHTGTTQQQSSISFISGWEVRVDSVCLMGQTSSLSIKKLFLARTCFWWCGRLIFKLGKSVAMFWIPKWLTD